MTRFQYKRRFADADAALKTLVPPKSPQISTTAKQKESIIGFVSNFRAS